MCGSGYVHQTAASELQQAQLCSTTTRHLCCLARIAQHCSSSRSAAHPNCHAHSHQAVCLLLCLFVLCQGSNHVQRKLKERLRGHKKLDAILADQFTTGRLYACISR